jgi:hypothetical protein
MTANRDFDDVARAWLDLMPSEFSDRGVASVIQAVEVTPQRRPWLDGPWRHIKMSRLSLLGAVATLVVLAGSILLWPRSSSEVVGSTPSPSASSTPGSPAASGSPIPGDGPLDDALRARWIATANSNDVLGNGGGPVSLSLNSVGTSIEAANFGAGNGFASSVTQAGDRLEVSLERAVGDCAAGAHGTYRWTLSGDRSQLTLSTVSEDCPKRSVVFARQWVRSLVTASTVGAGVVDSMDPDFAITLPDHTYETRTLDDFVEIGSPGLTLMAFKNPQPFVDACSTDEERVPYKPGAAAFVDAFRKNDAFVVGKSTPLRIDGHDALQVVIGGKADYARCPGVALYEYTPKACVCHFIVGQGDSDNIYLVEVGTDTFMFILSPFGPAAAQTPIISSLRIPFELPRQ